MKRGILVIVGIAMLLLGVSVIGAIPVTVIDAKTLTPKDTFFTGELEAIEKGTVSFEESGFLEYIVPVGTYVFNEIKDVDGNIIRKGTVLASQLKEKKELDLKNAIMEKKVAESNYIAAQRELKRNMPFVGRTVSQKAFDDLKTDLLQKKIALDKAETNVMIKHYIVDRATLYPPFSGIVTASKLQVGAKAGDGSAAVEITKMSPLLVKIPFPKSIIDNIKEGTKVHVYPAGEDKPVEGWCATDENNDMAYAYVNNKVVSTIELTPAQQKMKKVYAIFPAIPISDSNTLVGDFGKLIDYRFAEKEMPLSVAVEAIKTDDSGKKYVLKVDNEEDGLFEFKVKKVFVTPGKIIRNFNLGLSRQVKIQNLADNGGLSRHELLVVVGDKGIEDGETVINENLAWKFKPGQQVKLQVPALNPTGIYVPAKAVINQVDDDNYVYIVEDGKAKLVKVEIIGRSSSYNCITGDGIKDGAKIIVINDKSELNQLYDTASVEVKETLSAPIRITKPRAQVLKLSVSDIEKTFYSNL